MRLLLLSLCFLLPPFEAAPQLQCYHCISQLTTTDMTANERIALKTALITRFNIPTSNEFCQLGGSELQFRTVPRESCRGINDTCIRITSQGDENQKLVIRGCQSTLVKPGVDLVTNYSCHHTSDTTSSECITSCQEPLCNSSHGPTLILSLISVYCLIVY